MTNHQTLPVYSQRQQSSSGLKSLAQALDKLMDDQTSYLYLSLPESTVAEIQKSFTISTGADSGITDDGGS
jgi:hypothetical protein